MAEVSKTPPKAQDAEKEEEEAIRKAAQKLVDEAMDDERKRRVSEMEEELSDQAKLRTLDRLMNVQEQLIRQANLAKAKKAVEEEQLSRIQETEAVERKEVMQEQLRKQAVKKELAKGEEDERKRRMAEDKELSDERSNLYDHVISVQEELLQQFRAKLANLEVKCERQRQTAVDSKAVMQEQLLTAVHKKEVKKVVEEEQARLTMEMTTDEVERRVTISDQLTSVHQELLTKRSLVQAINPVLAHSMLQEIKMRTQEELQRRANQRMADQSMDQEQQRRLSEDDEPPKDFDEKNTRVKEELSRKASIKEAKKAQKEALDEYVKEEKKAKMQQEVIRHANQKMADRMTDKEQLERVEQSAGKESPKLSSALKEEICKSSK